MPSSDQNTAEKPLDKNFHTIKNGSLLPKVLLILSIWTCCFSFASQILKLRRLNYLFAFPLIIYPFRVLFTLLILPRSVGWEECISVATFVGIFTYSYSTVILSNTIHFNHPAIFLFSLVLIIIGVLIGPIYEFQRSLFKKNPKNKGKLYTTGLGYFVRHPNYFSDILLFLGWSLLGRNFFLLLMPLAVVLGFIYLQIPNLTQYLEQRYSNEWPAYFATTPALNPFGSGGLKRKFN